MKLLLDECVPRPLETLPLPQHLFYVGDKFFNGTCLGLLYVEFGKFISRAPRFVELQRALPIWREGPNRAAT